MSGTDRREEEIRRLMEGTRPAVPHDLADRAVRAGRRTSRRRRAASRAVWMALLAALLALAVWAVATDPWSVPPSRTTPPLEGW